MRKRMDEAVKRRVKAGRMLKSGKKPAEVAKAVGVARQTVYTWVRILEEGGIDALREINVGGRPAQLAPEQFERLRQMLLEGAPAQGFGTNSGPSSGYANSSSASLSIDIVKYMSGAFWVDWDFRARSPSVAQSSVTKVRYAASSGTPSPGLKKSPARATG